MPVTITVPCPTCAHLPVCALAPIVRDQLEPFRAPELITLPEALSVTASIEVDCRHFLDRGASVAARDLVRAFPSLDSVPTSGETWAERVARATKTDDPVSPELRAAVDLLEEVILGAGDEPVAETLPNIPDSIPDRRPDDYGMSESERRAALRADPLAAVARPVPRGRPAAPPTEVCEPGCGESFAAGIPYAEHRRGCEAWRAYAFAHTRQLPDIETAPMPDAGAARDEFDERRTAAAREAGQRAWDARHPAPRAPKPVDAMPEPAAPPAPSSTHDAAGLTARQQQIVDALRASGGRINAAAKSLGLGDNGGLSSTVGDLRRSNRLPADVDKLLADRRAERLGSKAQ